MDNIISKPDIHHRNEAACLCTDNAAFNPFGSVKKNHDLEDPNKMIETEFQLTYMGSTLEINDKKSFKATLILDNKIQFYPWVEQYKDGVIQVT